MQIEQRVWTPQGGWSSSPRLAGANLILVFAAKPALAGGQVIPELRQAYPKAHVAGVSTAGEIAGTHVHDGSVVATAVRLDKGHIEEAAIDLRPGEDSEAAGRRLAHKLPKDGLVHVLVLSDGHHVNGSDLVRGMTAALPVGVALTGGLAGDGADFRSTLTLSDAGARERRIVALGIYGAVQVGFGSLGGWDPFGPQRLVTRSDGNVLFELDGQPALALYKKYLGEHATGLPATGLLFPLAVTTAGGVELTRTILDVDEKAQSLTFAGDVPQGAAARLMKANFDRLVDGAHGAADQSRLSLAGKQAQLAILISCIGRKLVLKQRVEEELEAVQDVLGTQAAMAGFYSYGEICPSAPNAGCELHNQTMTITTLREE
jgi:hypothetical protein